MPNENTPADADIRQSLLVQKPPPRNEKNEPSRGGGGGGGSDALVVWEVTGTIRVAEKDISGVLMRRPLAGVEVEVFASTLGIYNSWGTVRTNSDGEFIVRQEKDRSRRKIKVLLRLSNSRLEVKSGALADLDDFISPAIVIFEHSHEVDGPTVHLKPCTFKAGANGELGDLETRRRAAIWCVWNRLIDEFVSHDPYLAFAKKIKLIYPAKVVSGTSYANGITRCAYIHEGNPWSIETVIHEGMHLWNYDHNHGTADWLGAVFCPPDLDTHAQSERRPIAFHEGFAKFAAQELMYEIWGGERDSSCEKPKPFTRYALVHELYLDTVDEVECSDEGVFRALCVLTARELYNHKWGDKNTRSDDQHPVRVATNPSGPPLTIWHVLKAFKANASAGYSTEWQTGNNDYGVRRFFRRAADLNPGIISPATRDLMLSLIDPDSTEEPSASHRS